MYNTVRTCARPPHIVRRPRRGPLSPLRGATPTKAAICCRVSVPQRGEFQQQRAGTHGPNALGTLQYIVVFPPQGAGPEHRLEVVVQRGDTRIEPRNRGLNVLCETRVGPRQTVLIGSPHADQLLAAPKEGAQLLRLGVRQ